jgi:hypothetical protein
VNFGNYNNPKKLCGMPHGYSKSFRCILVVDEKGNHNDFMVGPCLCSCVMKPSDEHLFFYDSDGKRKDASNGKAA